MTVWIGILAFVLGCTANSSIKTRFSHPDQHLVFSTKEKCDEWAKTFPIPAIYQRDSFFGQPPNEQMAYCIETIVDHT